MRQYPIHKNRGVSRPPAFPIPSFFAHDKLDSATPVIPVQTVCFFLGSLFQAKMHSSNNPHRALALLSNHDVFLRSFFVITHVDSQKKNRELHNGLV
jgi:hypothetical protein